MDGETPAVPPPGALSQADARFVATISPHRQLSGKAKAGSDSALALAPGAIAHPPGRPEGMINFLSAYRPARESASRSRRASVRVSILSGRIPATPGILVSYHAGLPSGAAIVLALGAFFLVSALASPRYGIVARLRHSRQERKAIKHTCA